MMADDALLPVVEELHGAPRPEEAFRRLVGRPHCLFLDSAMRDPQLGRYSFIAVDPFDFLLLRADCDQPFEQLSSKLARYRTDAVADLPPFQGGAAGLFGYDLCRSLERLPTPTYDEFQTPAMAVGLYDLVLAYDHALRRCWIISQGFPEVDSVARRDRARDRAATLRGWLDEKPADLADCASGSSAQLDPSALAPQFPVAGPAGLTSNFSAEAYLRAVRQVVEYIHAGDVFQVNLAQRLLLPAGDSAAELYLRLRRRNPATFAAYFDMGEFQIASASPERFLQVRGREIETRPIKGTRRRTRRPEADLFAGDELQQSEKDRAENVMIVDLLRNDLSRVCEDDSVRVTELCRLEAYEFVQHLVSVVQGRLRPEYSALDALQATFPGGSITGAPKVRAMEIIAELEPTARGPYCGCLGYIGFDGSTDTSILIRTITAGRGWWQAPVGGGIVAQSNPQREYEETWHKAAGILRSFEP